jgi:L-threonylcarbamoyladenylate synthase
MIVYTKEEFELNFELIIDGILDGQIFVYPTDTIYGLGCDATNSAAVKRVREIKEVNNRPFSVVVPNKTWIRDNCEVDEKVVVWLKKLPGPYTLILKIKNKSAIAKETNMGLDTIGVRILDHWIQNAVEKLGRPIVTTSANKPEHGFMNNIDNLDSTIRSKIDFIVQDGEKNAKPSTIIDLTKVTTPVKKR